MWEMQSFSLAFLPLSESSNERNHMLGMERGRLSSFTLKFRYAGHHSGGQSLMRWYVLVIKEKETMLGHQHLMPSAKVCTEMFSSG